MVFPGYSVNPLPTRLRKEFVTRVSWHAGDRDLIACRGWFRFREMVPVGASMLVND